MRPDLPHNARLCPAAARLLPCSVRLALLLLLTLTLSTAVRAQFDYVKMGSAIRITGYTGALTDVTIPGTLDGLPVTTIGDSVFFGRSRLTNVTIPDSVTSIGIAAFYGCTGLTRMSIPDGVMSFGEFAFADCTSLTNVTIPTSVTTIGHNAFDGCTSLTSVAIPASVRFIPGQVFRNCINLANVTIPDSVTAIGDGAFAVCTGLTRVTIPDGVTAIGYSAFFGCTGLTDVSLPASVTYIGQFAFYSCVSLASVTIPAKLTSIGYSAFDGCTGLTRFTVEPGNSVYASVEGVFFDKSRTTLFLYPSSKAGTSYRIPDGVKSASYGAFANCIRLTSVTFPASFTTFNRGVFSGYIGLSRFNVEPGNPAYASVEGVLFNKSRTTLVLYPSGKAETTYRIPEDVTSIGISAFRDCAKLTGVILPTSVTSIGAAAFFGCTGLASVAIPASVTSVGVLAFNGCTGLTRVYFEGNAPSLGGNAFRYTPATVYYLQGTQGWTGTFAGLPTEPWNARIVAENGQLGLPEGRFGFTLAGVAGSSVLVEASEDLGLADWTPVSTHILSAQRRAQFTDPAPADRPGRFYRVRVP